MAIPTWNRKPILDITLESICSQVEDLPVEVIVSDHGSTDGTFQMIQEKRKKYPFILPYVCRRQNPSDFSHNFKFTFGLPESKWTWTFGDDDIMLPGALKKVLSILDERVPFIHVGEISRTNNSMEVIEGQMIDLCNKIGLLDFTGFITGNVVRSDKLQAAVNSPNWDKYAVSAFPQSLSLLESLFYDNVAFIDYALIEAQDRDRHSPLRMEDDRGGRWAAENIGMRYCYVVPAIRTVLDCVGHKEPLFPSFFRYLNTYLWDRFAIDTINNYTDMIMKHPNDVFVHHFIWDAFAEMADYLNEENKVKVKGEIYAGRDIIDLHIAAIQKMNEVGVKLDEYCQRRMTPQFPYNYIGKI
jgi:glycosyltransferase involved in cell wall biosynthesis